MASLTRTRAEHESRLLEEKKRAERGKNLVVLMLQHLTNAGYTGTVEALTAESGGGERGRRFRRRRRQCGGRGS